MTVWDALVGQRSVIETLKDAVRGPSMTHAWLFTGPPGSGRSNVAMAFAAALQCEEGGCGECNACRTSLAGSHPDVSVTRSETSVLYIKDMRQLVHRSALAPAAGRWQVMVIEDADRLGGPDDAKGQGNALLKAIEEPTPRTVWLLCAPTVRDVLPTIRSRCRNVNLSTPTDGDVAGFLSRTLGVSESAAWYAARASQGHIGRAKALVTDEQTRNRRREVVSLPVRLTSLGACMTAAANLSDLSKEETAAITEESNAREVAQVEALYGSDRGAKTSRTYRAAVAELEKLQKQKEKRRVLDVVDRALMDLVSVYRDAIALGTNAGTGLVNEELRPDLERLVRVSTPEANLRRIDAIFKAREQMLDFNVPVMLALESMMVALRLPEGSRP